MNSATRSTKPLFKTALTQVPIALKRAYSSNSSGNTPNTTAIVPPITIKQLAVTKRVLEIRPQTDQFIEKNLYKAMELPGATLGLGKLRSMLYSKQVPDMLKKPVFATVNKLIGPQYIAGHTIAELAAKKTQLQETNASLFQLSIPSKDVTTLVDAKLNFEESSDALTSGHFEFMSEKITKYIPSDVLIAIQSNTPLTPAQKDHYEKGLDMVKDLCRLAKENKVSLTFDIAGTNTRLATMSIYKELAQEFNPKIDSPKPAVIGLAQQAYLLDTTEQIEALIKDLEHKVHFRLVTGAYITQATTKSREHTLKNFDTILKHFMLDAKLSKQVSFVAATQNLDAINKVIKLDAQRQDLFGDDAKATTISQLFGGENITTKDFQEMGLSNTVLLYALKGNNEAIMFLLGRAQDSNNPDFSVPKYRAELLK
jgi:hypothetical protein